jgi:hypothetical protein
MENESELDAIRRLANIANKEVVVLLPKNADEPSMTALIEKLKEIYGIEKNINWTTIPIDGIDYIATGIKRD